MIRTLIIDDEPRNIKLIAKIIGDHCPSLEIVGTTDNLTEVLPMVENLQPALLLLDIEFPSGNIFSVLEQLPVTRFQIIFITAHNTYASEAFKQQAVDYILKPVTKEAIVQAVAKAQERIQGNVNLDMAKMLELLSAVPEQPRKIPLPAAEGILFINESDIIRCEASGRYTIIYLKEKKLTVTKTLKEIEGLLVNARQFFRVHHSHIINLALITRYHRGQGGMAELADGSMVEVSASRKDELLNILLRKPKS
jgi:two-component system LytT family response regulator